MPSLRAVLSSRRFNRALPWIGATVLAAGGVTFLGVFYGNTGKSLETPAPKRQTIYKPPPKSGKLPQEARQVAARFILTAVARHDLAAAWKISGPQIRQGLTFREWMSGTIPVVPYPVTQLDLAPFRVDYAYKNEAQLQVALLPKDGVKMKPQRFVMVLIAVGSGKNRRWLVDLWAPHSPPPVPVPT